MKFVRKRLVVPVATAAAVLLTATSASAASWTDSRSTEGAAAKCRVWTTTTNNPDDTANISCDIQDSLDDRRTVYVDWWIYGNAKRRLSNTNGYGAGVTRTDKDRVAAKVSTVNWAVCRLNTFGDNCSEVVSHRP